MPTAFPARTALALAAWSAPAAAPHAPQLCAPLGIQRTITADGVWLTFDDGPHPQGTPAVLAALAAAGARATFFLVGEQVERRPALVDEIRAAGHQIALHGHTHRLHLRLGPCALADDLDRARDVLGEMIHHRAPYGVYSLPSLIAVRRRGWRPVLWSRWGRDWRPPATAATITEDVVTDTRAGDVLLLHDSDAYSAHGSWRATAAALPRILDTLGERGLATVLPEA